MNWAGGEGVWGGGILRNRSDKNVESNSKLSKLKTQVKLSGCVAPGSLGQSGPALVTLPRRKEAKMSKRRRSWDRSASLRDGYGLVCFPRASFSFFQNFKPAKNKLKSVNK